LDKQMVSLEGFDGQSGEVANAWPNDIEGSPLLWKSVSKFFGDAVVSGTKPKNNFYMDYLRGWKQVGVVAESKAWGKVATEKAETIVEQVLKVTKSCAKEPTEKVYDCCGKECRALGFTSPPSCMVPCYNSALKDGPSGSKWVSSLVEEQDAPVGVKVVGSEDAKPDDIEGKYSRMVAALSGALADAQNAEKIAIESVKKVEEDLAAVSKLVEEAIALVQAAAKHSEAKSSDLDAALAELEKLKKEALAAKKTLEANRATLEKTLADLAKAQQHYIDTHTAKVVHMRTSQE